jgi:hypothetical protein
MQTIICQCGVVVVVVWCGVGVLAQGWGWGHTESTQKGIKWIQSHVILCAANANRCAHTVSSIKNLACIRVGREAAFSGV